MLRRAVVLLLALSTAPGILPAQGGKKEKKEVTQALAVAPDPPAAVTVDTSRLTFHTSPLSGKGLLSNQVRDALKSLRSQAKGEQIVKIRAWVAGTGDLRRVQSIVSETFNDKRLPIPVLSTIQVGLHPLKGAQVVLEATGQAKKPVNPNGLVFLSGMGGVSKDDASHVLPMLDKAIADLTKATHLAGSDGSDVLRVTCMLSSLNEIDKVRTRLAAAFPRAALTAFQAQRAHLQALAECEATARLGRAPASPVEFHSPADMNPSAAYSKFVVTNSPRLVLTGSQMAFRAQPSDVRLAFERMSKVLESQQAGMKNVIFSSVYPLTNAISTTARNVRFDFYDKSRPPASTLLLFEGLPSIDASMALELVAVPQ